MYRDSAIGRTAVEYPWNDMDSETLVDAITEGSGMFAWVRGQLKIKLGMPLNRHVPRPEPEEDKG